MLGYPVESCRDVTISLWQLQVNRLGLNTRDHAATAVISLAHSAMTYWSCFAIYKHLRHLKNVKLLPRHGIYPCIFSVWKYLVGGINQRRNLKLKSVKISARFRGPQSKLGIPSVCVCVCVILYAVTCFGRTAVLQVTCHSVLTFVSFTDWLAVSGAGSGCWWAHHKCTLLLWLLLLDQCFASAYSALASL